MDEIGTKAIVIGVSIFVTLLILTVIILEYDQIQELYKFVGETDISFEQRLDELDKYRDSNNEFTGLDVRNTLKKYSTDKSISVCISSGAGEICDDGINTEGLDYKEKYMATLVEQTKTFKIIFTLR